MSYKNIHSLSPRLWKSTTGLSKRQFELLLPKFQFCYENYYKTNLTTIFHNLNIENPILSTYEACLFFVLFQLKNGLTFDVLGFVFNTDGSNAHRNFERYLLVLEQTLEQEDMLPKRLYKTVTDLITHLGNETDLIFDGTEFPIERPADNESQKKAFSGKKNARQKSSNLIK
jgi:Helix-turn-helix of DDE superfamily endonuclease